MRRRQIGYARGGVPVHAFSVDSPSHVRVVLAEYGARILRIETPDRLGKIARIFGPPGEVDSIDVLEARGGLGSTHCALAGARRDGPAHSVWWGEALADGVRFHYASPAGEEGRDAEVECRVEYRLDERGTLSIEHAVRLGSDTNGALRTALDLVTPLSFDLGDPNLPRPSRHELWIESREIAEYDAHGYATGHLQRIGGTPLDRRKRRTIASDAAASPASVDYVLARPATSPREVAVLAEPRTGRRVAVSTDRPILRLETRAHGDASAQGVALFARDSSHSDRHSYLARELVGTDVQHTTRYHFGLDV